MGCQVVLFSNPPPAGIPKLWRGVFHLTVASVALRSGRVCGPLVANIGHGAVSPFSTRLFCPRCYDRKHVSPVSFPHLSPCRESQMPAPLSCGHHYELDPSERGQSHGD